MNGANNDKLEAAQIDDEMKQKKIDRANIHTNCLASAAMTINTLHGHGRMLDCPTVMENLIKSANKISTGNTTEIEQMLMSQAKTLDYIFYDALNKLSEINMYNQMQILSDIAFKSQAQCRKTLAVLAELKNPRRSTTFIKQQNNQQINNTVKPENFKNSTILANELVSEVQLENMDNRETLNTSPINATTETMGTFNRTENILR